MTLPCSTVGTSDSLGRFPVLAAGYGNVSFGGNSTRDSNGFLVSEREKALEEKYLRKHPERAKDLSLWTDIVKRWDETSYSCKKRLCRKGIPPSMRRLVWPLLLNTHRAAFTAGVEYSELKSAGGGDYSETFAIIERDLGRTFPGHPWFAQAGEDGQMKLRNILQTYVKYDPVVGYVQGMGFLAATLLLQVRDEETSFWCFFSLMQNKKYGMAEINAPGFPGLHMRFDQLQWLMKRKCGLLLRFLEKNSIVQSFYAMSWYMTLFSSNLNFFFVARIWDMFFCEGWKPIHRVAIAFFLLSKKAFKQAKDEADLLLILQNMLNGKSADLVLKTALKVKFKTADLISWEKKKTACHVTTGGKR